MNDVVIGKALLELADVALCVSGDFHVLHLNVKGVEFDAMHKVSKKYYEEAAKDYDELAEKARMFDVIAPNPNEAASRIGYPSLEGIIVDRNACVAGMQRALEALVGAYAEVCQALSQALSQVDQYDMVGTVNFLEDRLEKWSKEACFFNKSRM